MNTLVPSLVLLVLLIASTATTVLVLRSSIRSLRLSYQADVAAVNESLLAVRSQQGAYAQQVQALTRLVTESMNATDEYIHNITNAVTETKGAMQDNLETVQEVRESQNSLMAVQFAGMFTLLVILVSGYHLSQHLRNMHSPVVQRKIMAVLWMTPLYSLSSWMSLVFEGAGPYLAVIREFYESYCVYMFMAFLISVLGRGDRRAVVDLLEGRADQLARPDKCRCGPKFWRRCWTNFLDKCGKRRRVPNDLSLTENVVGGNVNSTNKNGGTGGNPTPAQQQGRIDEAGYYLSPARLKAEAVLDQCQLYAMQFVLLRPVTAIGWLVSNQLFHPKGFLDPTTPQLYITLVTNASIFFAFRGLVRFYHATRRDLAWCNPWPKFLCIKGVVFMTFWQRMTLSLVVDLGYADRFDSREDAADFVDRAQDFLICLEMLFSAVAHCFVFSPDEWAEGYREREEERRKNVEVAAFGDSVALGDFINDVKVVLASKKRRRRKRTGGGEAGGLSPDSNGGATSPASTGDDLDLSLSQSSGGDSDDEKSPGPPLTTGEGGLPRQPSALMRSLGGEPAESPADEHAGDYMDEYVNEVATPPASNKSRRRLDTGGSADSYGAQVGGSMRRIEMFISQHSPRPGDGGEVV